MALSNAQYNDIMRVYQKRQLENFHELEKRKEEIDQVLPKIRVLTEEVSGLALEAAKQMQAGDKQAIVRMRQRTEEIVQEKKALLISKGYPADYLEMHYTCSDCKDTGYVDGQKCHCFRAMQTKLLYAQSNIEKILRKENFRTFNYAIFDDKRPISQMGGKTNRSYMREVVAALKRYIRDFDQKHGNLIFMGSTGVGKTFLTNCIAKELIDSYHSVIYLSASDLFETFFRGNFSDEEEQRDMNDAVLNCDLLIIDDLGTELNNSFTTSKFFYVLNQRLVAEKATIISTNLTFQTIGDHYSDRVASRIMSGYDVIPLYGNDQRLISQ